MTPLFQILAAQDVAPEVIDRIPSGYSHFVIPFAVGITFMLCWLLVGCVRLLAAIPRHDRLTFFKSLFIPKTIVRNLKDLFGDCLLHLKIWRRKPLLGYMHSAIAFGWFMIIVLGHIEVALFVPKRLSVTNGGLFYPIFYRYFVWMNPGHTTLRGSFFFFLMDFFLLYILSGIALAVFKRFRSIVLGMRHTTKPSLADRVALYSLWLIFPLRLLAESFTADLSGGSFLTVGVNRFWHLLFGDKLWFTPCWWAYSISLGLFFVAMPFSRYMHILTEVLWILLRNAGIKPNHPRKGVAEAEIYACSSCGLCLDACPMNVQKKNLKYSSVYFIRFLRRHNEKKISAIADKCLMCDKCHALCPVGVDAPALRRAQRATENNSLPFDYSCISTVDTGRAATGVWAPDASRPVRVNGRPDALPPDPSQQESLPDASRPVRVNGRPDALPPDPSPQESLPDASRPVRVNGRSDALPPDPSQQDQRLDASRPVLYFAGCMTRLTPRIIKAVESVFEAAGVDYVFGDREGGMCCGRPLMLAGRNDAAAKLIEANKKMIEESGCSTLVLSCPICYKIFKEEYRLEGIKVTHYTQYFNELIASGRLKVEKTDRKLVYHDPCELGRGCGVYFEPRAALGKAGTLVKASMEYDESICCGGSLGSLTLDVRDRAKIAEASLKSLTAGSPDTIVTACPLCLKTFSEAVANSGNLMNGVAVKDFAEVLRG